MARLMVSRWGALLVLALLLSALVAEAGKAKKKKKGPKRLQSQQPAQPGVPDYDSLPPDYYDYDTENEYENGEWHRGCCRASILYAGKSTLFKPVQTEVGG